MTVQTDPRWVDPGVVERAHASFGLVADWVFCDAMNALLGLFGKSLPARRSEAAGVVQPRIRQESEHPEWVYSLLSDPGSDRRQLSVEEVNVLIRLLALESSIAEDFDFRGRAGGDYKERAEAATADFGANKRSAIQSICDDLGLVTASKPARDAYDMCLILGGGYRSPLLRAGLAARLGAQGIELGRIYGLGSPRFLLTDPPESPVVAEYAPDARDEFDLMGAAIGSEFDLGIGEVRFVCGCASASVVCPAWPFINSPEAGETPSEYTHLREAPITDPSGRSRGAVLSARTSRPPFRPNTADTYEFLGAVARLAAGNSALVATTQVFVPFQHYDGLRSLWLPFGVDVDTVGFGPEYGDRPLTSEYLLQEVLSAVRSARRLILDSARILFD